MFIIGLTGKMGSGKDTVAFRLAYEHGAKVLSFADPLYEALAVMTNLPVYYLKVKKETAPDEPLEPYGKTVRELLQTLGTEWGRAHNRDWWIIRMQFELESRWNDGRLNEDSIIVFPDIRFDNEAEWVRGAGSGHQGEVWEVVGKHREATVGLHHDSELGLQPENVDHTILNGAGLDDLYAVVDHLFYMARKAYG